MLITSWSMLVSLCLLKQIQTFRLIYFSELKHNFTVGWVDGYTLHCTGKLGVLYGHVSSYTETFYKYVLMLITLFLKMGTSVEIHWQKKVSELECSTSF